MQSIRVERASLRAPCAQVTLSHRCLAPLARAQAQAQSTSAPAMSSNNQLLMAAVEALFKFPPFFNMATKKARSMIVQRGQQIGLDWDGTMQQLQQQDWEAAMAAVQNKQLQYPSYYTQPFHAYSQGNLCWDAALEVELAAQSVHAPVMDPTGKSMDPKGDHALRSSYSRCMLQLMDQMGVPQQGVQDVVDLGCATGLSTLALQEIFPEARFTGVDLSPHFLAVGRYNQQQREAQAGGSESIHFIHGKAEETGLPSSSYDLVSMCLVAHELPHQATEDIMKEAFRLLRPGGVFCIMDMNPASPAFQRIFGNPFAYTAFKSTEPWLEQYVSLDMPGALKAAGFSSVGQLENSPRHRTVVAKKA